MKIEINPDKPWLSQLVKVRKTLVSRALKQTNGNRREAAKILGCSPRTVRYEIRHNPDNASMRNNRYVVSDSQLKRMRILFELGYSIHEISIQMELKYSIVINRIQKMYTIEEFNINNKKNIEASEYRRKKMISTAQDLLNNNRLILTEIAEKIRDNKVDELSDEHIFYAQILFKNGFITKDGIVTEEGRDALYH